MTDTQTVEIGVLGGSGLYNMPEITDKSVHEVETPFGDPSGPIVVGTLRGKRVAFLPRHGEGHTLSPTTLPYRANIYALKSLGVRYIIAISACGSLQEAYAPGTIMVPDQLYDNTKSDRGRSFFEKGLVAHVSVADPFDEYLRGLLVEALGQGDGEVHDGGLFITVEGPRFSTRGESHLFRNWGCDIIGMTTSPEAYLAAEAEMAYAVLAHITDYDVWKEEETVTAEMVMKTVGKNIELAKQALAEAVEALDTNTVCPAHSALSKAITTQKDAIPSYARERLDLIVGKYL